MAEILLDSDVVIAWLRGTRQFAALVPRLIEEGETLSWTPVSIAEIFAGVRKGEERRVETLLVVLDTVPLSAEIGHRAGNYLRRYRRSHGVEIADALIAAAALVSGMPLWTLNRRHYPMADLDFFSQPSR